MAIFDRLFGRRKKDEQQPAPDAPQAPVDESPALPDAPAVPAPDDARPAPAPAEPVAPLREPDAAPPAGETAPAPAESPSEPRRARRAFQADRRDAGQPGRAPRPSPAPQPSRAPQPAPAPQTNLSHLDGWHPSAGPAEALARYRESAEGNKRDRARRELSRHMIGTGYFTVLGPGGDGKPTIKAAVVNSERMLTVYSDRSAAEAALTKNGQVAEIPGQVLMAWVLSQPKVQGLRIDPAEEDAPKDFTRDHLTEALKGLVNPGLRDVLVSERPTPQRGLEAMREEGAKVLVVRRRTAAEDEHMLLEGPHGERVLPVFTSESEADSLGTSLAPQPMDADSLRDLIRELGVEILRVNPSGPSLDLPANSL
ncbi:SseB family protein [Arthrobacter sp. UM1]|uniref:SseB family protein n=1 Tax=Arthrobacter sp. UM1 TaxID=2766776 RepID=UPI001CF676DB|nr:SseB family protein [Arthrobacter sp. UM1]MCB4208361.1 hypothetical protein [Arthrobacter sp. UM1]